jgi:hypothetical protein
MMLVGPADTPGADPVRRWLGTAWRNMLVVVIKQMVLLHG